MTLLSYADDIETARQVASDTGLLLHGHSVLGRLANAHAYTREVALKLHDRGWGLLFKGTGFNVDHLAVDCIVNVHTGDVVQVVRGAGEVDQVPCWSVRRAGAARLYVSPVDGGGLASVPCRGDHLQLQLIAALERVLALLGDGVHQEPIHNEPLES